MEIISILPCFYAKDSINRKFTEEELKRIDYYRNKTYKNSGNNTSTYTRVLDTEFLDIRNKIFDVLGEYTSRIICPSNKNLKLKITQSWLNYTQPGGYHHPHMHANSIVSGVVYFQTGEDDKIQFIGNKPENYLKIDSNTLNQYNGDTWWIPVKAGDIILFPSYQRHGVPPTNINSLKTRVSLSFNTFVDGDLGNEQDLTHLSVRLN